MNPTQSNPRESLQQAIDTKIQSLEESLAESIRVLRLQRNALAAVSSLPAEVFTAIFTFLCLPEPGEPHSPQHHLARLHVSHTCHQWREIALNHPLLWSHIDFTTLSLAGAAEMLVRAKSKPLYLEARVSEQRWDDVQIGIFQKELQAFVPHICDLFISTEHLDPCKFLDTLISPAPTLENLSLFRGKYGLRTALPENLFGGITPRLSCLELHNCDISWKSPLLKDLRYLDIRLSSTNKTPSLSAWLDALDKMPQLRALTLHRASPSASSFIFDVKRTVTFPSLTHLDILASPGDCALALAHLDAPALTSLCLTAFSISLPNSRKVQNLLPYVVRHAHGIQDTQPLQSVLIRNNAEYLDILAWPVPNIDVESYDPPTFLGATLPTRLAFSFQCDDSLASSDARLEILDTVMAGLPLDNLVMFATQDLRSCNPYRPLLPTKPFWTHLSPKWPLLQRVRLAPPSASGFIEMLLEDNEGHERPLLPSLTDLVVVDFSLYQLLEFSICDALMKRVEQGVPLEMLDLRMCYRDSLDGNKEGLRLLSQIVVNVLDPEGNFEAREQMKSMWNILARGPFIDHDDSSEDDEE